MTSQGTQATLMSGSGPLLCSSLQAAMTSNIGHQLDSVMGIPTSFLPFQIRTFLKPFSPSCFFSFFFFFFTKVFFKMKKRY
jgi:hypothetical protein